MALALIGNFLSIMAIRKKISKSSAAIYMLNLAIFDMLSSGPGWVIDASMSLKELQGEKNNFINLIYWTKPLLVAVDASTNSMGE